ncbi:MAG: DUF2791 family P-loop domain-containing protein [bacterium]|nr:DUF2791 family P-loop domain-containing protein [bacterium]
MIDNLLACRRAIEAVRAGVPNRDAVLALGCSQPHIEERFQQGLRECRELAEQGKQAKGLLVAGDFGTGKSHLLEHLHHLALDQNLVSSKIVISKETPLFDPSKFYRSAIDAAVVPGKQGGALREIAETLDRSRGYRAFYERVTSDKSALDSRFGATLYIYEHVRIKDLELSDRAISFWSGRKLNVSEIKKALRQIGESVTYPLRKISERELAHQRFRFASQLMVAAGYSGWVLLVDEAELIGRYSLLQRARSYAELARWMGALGEDRGFPSIFTVFAITPDFETAVLEEKDDRDKVRARLAARGTPDDLLMASEAERGMREIPKAVKLKPLGREQIETVAGKLQKIHAQAYLWNPPAIQSVSEKELRSTRMRTHVRTWVNQWDLQRLHPSYEPDIETTAMEQRFEEDKDLEVSTEENEDEHGAAPRV